MRKQHRLLTALLLAGLVTVPRLAAQDSPSAVKKGLFWKATSGANTLYLLGSIHIGSKDMYPLPKEFEDAFAASKTLIVEVDIGKVDMQKLQAMVLSRGMYGAGDTLWNHVDSDVRQQLEEFCDQYQMPAMVLGQMKPWLVSITVATIPMIKNGMDPNLGIDKYFLDKAAEEGSKKNVVEIESADWQMNLLSGFSDDVQAKLLASSVKQAGKSIDQSKKIQDLWIRGDAAKVEAALHEDAGPPEVEKVLLYDRNPHMAEVAEQYLKGKDQAFLVVGAAHLVGKQGVVSLLEKRGYKVQQVALAK
ncbi:MAG: TraB/GumN family protein [Candidatus Sulfopaludibacter sp.]|nr:TraB/GumN family protein [Candidatus Sulfopaludibacter sp.]